MVHVPGILEARTDLHPMKLTPCVVVPAYQAEKRIYSLIQEIRVQGLMTLVVDDASKDATTAEARRAGARVITRSVNGGKGAALRDGLAEALREGYSWILIMDADGQHLPAEIPRFLKAAKEGRADLILGNRMEDPHGMPWDRWLTNRIMSWLLSRLIQQKIPDTQCGFRLIARKVFESVPLTSEHFEIESELVVKAALAGFRIVSIPVSSVYRRQLSFIRPLRDTTRFFLFLKSIRRNHS